VEIENATGCNQKYDRGFNNRESNWRQPITQRVEMRTQPGCNRKRNLGTTSNNTLQPGKQLTSTDNPTGGNENATGCNQKHNRVATENATRAQQATTHNNRENN